MRILPSPFGRFDPPLAVLPHVVDCYQRTDQIADAGDRVPVDLSACTPALRNVPCWVQPANPTQILEAQRLQLVITHSVTFYQNPLVRNGDYLLFRGSRTLVIQGINDTLELGFVWVVTAREIG